MIDARETEYIGGVKYVKVFPNMATGRSFYYY